MDKIIKPARLYIIILIIAVLTAIFVVTLYSLQIVEGAAYYAQSQDSISTTVSVPAARGDILDRYGRPLVSNKVVNDLTIDAQSLFEQADPNAVILKLTKAVTDSGAEYTDTLPITKEAPFEYVDNMTDTQRTLLSAYLKSQKLPDSTSAVELMAYFRKKFDIDSNYSSDDMRTIAGVRYEIKVRYVTQTADYIFARDVSIDLITKLMEQNIPGFNVVNSYEREYDTSYAAHLLGGVGLMDADEYKTFKEKGYLMNAEVGKSGAESAFEQYLHASDGQAVVTKTRGGTIINTRYTKSPEPGDQVELTIDLGLQETAENALASFITSNNATRESQNAAYKAMGDTKDVKDLITGGAIVAVNVKTGEPLCLASYPTYDLATYSQNAEELNKAKNSPLVNRALAGLYAPGSTFKPVTAIASLAEGIITPGATIYDKGKFTKYAKSESDYAPECWIYPGSHGYVNTTKAIEVSCNYYFYTVGDQLGIDKLSDYAKRFGLGEHTGIELSESVGQMASRAEKEAKGESWMVGDTLQAAIGQSDSLFTPLQIANYLATVANNGTRYKASMLKSVRSYDGTKDVYDRTPEVAATVSADQSYYDAVHQGLYNVANATDGTAYKVFGNYGVKVAAKTGTAQLGEGITNNAIFMCYAPYDDPEIAISVVIEKGNAGSAIATVAKQVLDYYFSFKNNSTVYENENALLK